MTVGNRAITVSLPTDTENPQRSLVYDGTVVHRRRVWADQRAVPIDLYGVELDYSDATYGRAGYRPGPLRWGRPRDIRPSCGVRSRDPGVATDRGRAERRGLRDPRFLALGETRGYLGTPVGDTYADSDDPSTLEMSPESLSPSVTFQCVSGNVGPQDPSTTTSARNRFATLPAEHMDAVTIAGYRLDVSVQGPTVTDK